MRKPGAFANYRYREHLFPSSRFRRAYDLLKEVAPRRCDRRYLEILELAAKEGEALVEDALRLLLQSDAGRQTIVNKEAFAGVPRSLRAGARHHRRPIAEVSLASLRSAVQPTRGGDAMSQRADIKADLTQSLKYLHLPTIRQCYEEVARQAERETLSYERYLHELVQRECDERPENRTTKMLRESQLPLEKSLEAFDTRRLPPKAARQMRTLLDGGFLERTENVLVFGNPGSGKTHMLQAVGQELIRKGHRMLFTTCEMLVQELLIAKRDLKLSKLIKKYSRYEGMIIDDLGYIRQTREEMEVVFTLLAERYERGSVLLTSNLPFSKWEGIFKDPMTTAAAIDRLVHHSIIIELNIPSYRLEQAKSNVQSLGSENTHELSIEQTRN